MRLKSLVVTFILALIALPTFAQSFVGLVQYRNTYQYVKISCEDGSCKFSAPDLDNDKKYPTSTDVTKSSSFEVQRGIERWQFDCKLKDDVLAGELHLPTGRQSVKFRKQLQQIPEKEQGKYCGTFVDAKNRRAVIYSQNGYLHFMSPYAEETVSLKPIAENSFWSATGETTVYSKDLASLVITNHSGATFNLKKAEDTKFEERFITIGEDTIYARILTPAGEGPHPACLILPGGGSVGIDNYMYEARYLAAYGFKTLVFDKAGNGKSKGPNRFVTQTFEQKNDRYIKLFRYLRNQPDVDPKRVGVHGPSEGGRLALLMAIDLQDTLAFAQAVAAPMMPFREGQLYAMDHFHRQRNVDEVDNMMIRQIWNNYYDGICAGKIDSTDFSQIRAYQASGQQLFLPPAATSLPVSPNKADIENERILREAHKITCPILFQYGESDQRVHGPKSLVNFLPLLSDKVEYHVIIYPRGNHSFMTPEFKICTGYEDDKLRWLKTIGIIK